VKYLTVQEVICTNPPAFGVRLDPLIRALLRLEEADGAIEDPDFAADLGSDCVDVLITVEAPDPAAAMAKALATLRAAIRAIGGADSGWESTSAAIHVEPADLSGRPRASA
jgi:hypothetical protein